VEEMAKLYKDASLPADPKAVALLHAAERRNLMVRNWLVRVRAEDQRLKFDNECYKFSEAPGLMEMWTGEHSLKVSGNEPVRACRRKATAMLSRPAQSECTAKQMC
jgi:hypothetical protein